MSWTSVVTAQPSAGPSGAHVDADEGAPEAAGEPDGASTQDAAQRAKALFTQGVADYDAGRYEPALANFQEAFRIKPHPLVRVNMANCYDKLDKPLQAIVHFERFMESDAGEPQQRQEVRAAIARLEMRVGSLSLTVTPDGASVVIDGADRRTSPIAEPVRLQAGEHELRVELEGYTTERRELRVHGGKRQDVTITLQPDAPEPAPPPVVASQGAAAAMEGDDGPRAHPVTDAAVPALAQRDAREPRGQRRARMSSAVWIAGGATASLLVGATITGLMALSAEDEFRTQRALLFDTGPGITTFDRIGAYNNAQDAADRANALALTTDILLGGALIGAGLTTYLVFNDPGSERRTQLTPLIGAGHAGLRVAGTL